jgi:hypothetical protein
MPKYETHPAFKNFSGTIGDLVFYVLRGKPVVRRRTEPPTTWSQNQVVARAQFRLATIYAKSVCGDPVRTEVYMIAAEVRGCAPYHVALTDFLNPPEVKRIDLSRFGAAPGSRLTIEAEDDFEVVQVHVAIQTPDGAMIEEGDARREAGSGKWIYLSQNQLQPGQTIAINATATDRPLHTGSLRVFWCAPGA